MSTESVVVQGTVKQDGTLELCQPIPLPPGPVELTIRSTVPVEKEDTWKVLERIWAEQKALGMIPRTREEIDAEINALRDESEERMREIEKIYEDARRAEEPPC